jgi:hypothetical protein
MSEEINVDALVQEAMTPEPAPEAATEGIVNDAQAEAPSEETSSNVTPEEGSRVLKYKGEEISLDDDRYKNYAQKGYDYEQKMHQMRVDQKLFEQERESWTKKNSEIEQINEYAKANPQFEQLIQQEWAKVQNGQAREMDPQTEIQVMQSQLRTLMEQNKSITEAAETRRIAEMEATQEGAIAKFKEEHAYLDWSTKDDQGLTLEDHVGQKMQDKRVADFEVMARAMLMDKIIAHKAMEGKESVAKGIQKAKQLGLGKITEKSQLGVKKADDVSNKTMDQLAAEAIAELGLN